MKSYLLFFVSLFLIGGCASLESPVIEAAGNTFSSSNNPSVIIELPLDFKYLGHVSKTLSNLGGLDYNQYMYASLTGDNFLKKIVTVTMQTLHHRLWSGHAKIGVKKPLKFNVLKVGSKKFTYTINVRKKFGKFTTPCLVDKGIVIPTCIMSMQLRRVFPAQVVMYIEYFEDLSNYKDFGIDSCDNWKEKTQLNDEQKEFLQKFEQRALNAIKIY